MNQFSQFNQPSPETDDVILDRIQNKTNELATKKPQMSQLEKNKIPNIQPLTESEFEELFTKLNIDTKYWASLAEILQKYVAYFARLLYFIEIEKLTVDEIQKQFLPDSKSYQIINDIDTIYTSMRIYIESHELSPELENKNLARDFEKKLYAVARERGYINTLGNKVDLDFLYQFGAITNYGEFENFITQTISMNINYIHQFLEKELNKNLNFDLFKEFITNAPLYIQMLILVHTGKYKIAPSIFIKVAKRIGLLSSNYIPQFAYVDYGKIERYLLTTNPPNQADILNLLTKLAKVRLDGKKQEQPKPLATNAKNHYETEAVDREDIEAKQIKSLGDIFNEIEYAIQTQDYSVIDEIYLQDLNLKLDSLVKFDYSDQQLINIIDTFNKLISNLNGQTDNPNIAHLLKILMIGENKFWIKAKSQDPDFQDELEIINLPTSKINDFISTLYSAINFSHNIPLTEEMLYGVAALLVEVDSKKINLMLVILKIKSSDIYKSRLYRILLQIAEENKIKNSLKVSRPEDLQPEKGTKPRNKTVPDYSKLLEQYRRKENPERIKLGENGTKDNGYELDDDEIDSEPELNFASAYSNPNGQFEDALPEDDDTYDLES